MARSVAGFVQQLAVGYIAKGYYFYVSGVIPAGKDPAKTDRKIIEVYGISVSKWTRARQKKQGEANVVRSKNSNLPRFNDLQSDQQIAPRPLARLSLVEELVLKFARENRSWGCRRIVGALSNLGDKVSHQTVANVLRIINVRP